MSAPSRVRRVGVAAAVIAAASVLPTACAVAESGGQAVQRALPGPETGSFPQLDEAVLTPPQRRFLQVVRAEHQAQRPGTTYSEGVDEPWCGDFVSWVARESGTPLVNAGSGGWRVPGIFTLQESLAKAGTWHAAGSAYTPKLGDIAIYRDPSPFGDHTNFVLSYDGTRLTTVGGNEPGGIVVSTHDAGAGLHLMGYGER